MTLEMGENLKSFHFLPLLFACAILLWVADGIFRYVLLGIWLITACGWICCFIKETK